MKSHKAEAWLSKAECRRDAPNPSVEGTSCGKPQVAPYVER